MVQEKLLFQLKQTQFLLINSLSKHLFQSFNTIQAALLEQVLKDKEHQALQDMQIKKQIGDTLSYTMNIQDLKEL
jgi:hypothetical protein